MSSRSQADRPDATAKIVLLRKLHQGFDYVMNEKIGVERLMIKLAGIPRDLAAR